MAIADTQRDQIDELTDFWTYNYLIDVLKEQLSTIKYSICNEVGKNLYDCRKYYDLAHRFLKIAGFKPVPRFSIYLADLSSEIIQKLYELEPMDLDYVLKQSVGRIFEDVNREIYHNSISRILEVELNE